MPERSSNDPGHDRTLVGELARGKHMDMAERAKRGALNARHGAGELRSPLWERLFAWLIIVAFLVVLAWFVFFGYRLITGDDGTPPDATTAVPVEQVLGS